MLGRGVVLGLLKVAGWWRLVWKGESMSGCVCVWGWQADPGGFEHTLRCPGLSDSSQVTSAWGLE